MAHGCLQQGEAAAARVRRSVIKAVLPEGLEIANRSGRKVRGGRNEAALRTKLGLGIGGPGWVGEDLRVVLRLGLGDAGSANVRRWVSRKC